MRGTSVHAGNPCLFFLKILFGRLAVLEERRGKDKKRGEESTVQCFVFAGNACRMQVG